MSDEGMRGSRRDRRRPERGVYNIGVYNIGVYTMHNIQHASIEWKGVGHIFEPRP
jgi:hypothetical protein